MVSMITTRFLAVLCLALSCYGQGLEFIKSHLPADLIQQIMAKLPALAQLAGGKAE